MVIRQPDFQVSVLEAAYRAARQEFQSMEHLLTLDRDSPLYSVAVVINSRKFGSSQINNLLEHMHRAIDQRNLCEAWTHFLELREALHEYSNELLGIIGGVYVKEKVLDDVRQHVPKSEDLDVKRQFSFSSLATALVDDLAYRSALGWQSVLIVGEERSGIGMADIIHLRFPAWDLWNLPLTAHEYGYLRARVIPTGELADFRTFRDDEVRRLVDPSTHEDGERPGNASCFLPAVRQLWRECDDASEGLEGESRRQAREKFARDNKTRIQKLKDEQEDFVCRLFADAFATYFAGPAYVHALVHLRFAPDRLVRMEGSGGPPLALRFVFALETLGWMNHRPDLDPGGDVLRKEQQTPFADEVDPTSGLRLLWTHTIPACDNWLAESVSELLVDQPSPGAVSPGADVTRPDWYAAFQRQFLPWWERIREALRSDLWTQSTITKTYMNWDVAKSLEAQLVSPGGPEELPSWPDKWAVLNAAWTARWHQPENVDLIYQWAAELLGPPNPARVAKPAERVDR